MEVLLMSRFHPGLLLFLIGLSSFIFWANAQAQGKEVIVTTTPTVVTTTPTVTTTTTPVTAVVEEHVIVTPVPTAKEVIVTPTGYFNCFTVNAGWYRNEWIPAHRICQYENMPNKVAWVEGYWACTKYKVDESICTDWQWRAGHWVETLAIY